MKRKGGRLFLWIPLVLFFLFLLAGCNSGSSSDSDGAGESQSVEESAGDNPQGGNTESEGSTGGTSGDEEPGDGESAGEDAADEDPGEDAAADDGTDDGTNDGSTDEASAEKGTLTLYLADATTNYRAVYVTIAEVQVHRADGGDEDGGWITVCEPEQTYNLLELVNGVVAELGATELETGHYTMLRMILGDNPDNEHNLDGYGHCCPNYLLTESGEEIPLFVPSGYQTGIKLVSGFDIVAGASTELVLDFDAARSVVKAGRSGKYLLKPTIKVVDAISRADISGTVTDADDDPVAGAIVSAQIYHEGSGDSEPSVEVFTSTQTTEDGQYTLYVPAGDYLVVAYKAPAEGESLAYGPGCRRLEAEYNFGYTENFTLETNETGTLLVETIIDFEDEFEYEPDQSVEIKAWKSVACNGENVLAALLPPLHKDLDSETFEMVLPEGNYAIVANVEETMVRINDVEVEITSEDENNGDAEEENGDDPSGENGGDTNGDDGEAGENGGGSSGDDNGDETG